MEQKFYYVVQTNYIDGTQELLGYNLNEKQKDDLFYSLGKNKNSSNGDTTKCDSHLQNAYGVYPDAYKSKEIAIDELITKPQKFDEALYFLNKLGLQVVKKDVVHKSQIIDSYYRIKNNGYQVKFKR